MIQFPANAMSFLALAAVMGLGGCKPVQDRKEVTTTREIGRFPQKSQLGLSFRERVGITSPESERGAEPGGSPFVWEKPETWKEASRSAMRVANFTFGPSDEGECYFSAIPGGGDLLVNVNRWRNQMGLPPVDAAAAAALPDRPLLFGFGKSVDLSGDFTAMGAPAAKKDHRMLGIILPQSDLSEIPAAFFVKMIGPAALVEAERANFDAFCNSLKIQTR